MHAKAKTNTEQVAGRKKNTKVYGRTEIQIYYPL